MAIELFDTVMLTEEDGYHKLGNIVALPGFEGEGWNGPVPYYAVRFSCADGTIEGMLLSADEMRLASVANARGEPVGSGK